MTTEQRRVRRMLYEGPSFDQRMSTTPARSKSSSVEQLSQSASRLNAAGTAERGETGQPRLRLVQSDVPDLPAVAAVPAKGRAVKTLQLLVSEEQDKLQGFDEPHMR
jgi:hypothetical protein